MAALSVLSFHVWLYQLSGPIRRPGFAQLAIFEARTGLVFFFVLSGFLVYLPFARATLENRSLSLRTYLTRRVARIVPAYYVAILGAVVLLATAGDAPGRREVDLEYLPLFLLFLQNYFSETVLQLDGPTWTLVVEVAFYLILPVLWLALWRRWRDVRAHVAVLVAFIAVGLTWNVLVHVQGWSTIATHTVFPFLPYFAAGMLVALLTVRGRGLGPTASGLLAVGGVIAIALNGYWHATNRAGNLGIDIFRDMLAAGGMAAIVAAATLGSGKGMGWLNRGPLPWLGTVSYAFYLWQVPVIVWLNGHDLLPGGVIGMLVVLPLLLAIGAASWYWLERPIVERARRGTRVSPGRES